MSMSSRYPAHSECWRMACRSCMKQRNHACRMIRVITGFTTSEYSDAAGLNSLHACECDLPGQFCPLQWWWLDRNDQQEGMPGVWIDTRWQWRVQGMHKQQ
jgi:hypothetical protein